MLFNLQIILTLIQGLVYLVYKLLIDGFKWIKNEGKKRNRKETEKK